MNTIIKKIDVDKINEEAANNAFEEASELILSGSLVAFPTETVYGLGANALDEAACAGIFAAKGRPGDNPLIVHISDLGMLDDLCEITDTSQKLMDAFWPGALTIIMQKKEKVPNIVTAGLTSVAVRLPANPIAKLLIKTANTPIAAPSANLSGRPSPTSAEHVYEDFSGKIPLIIDGGQVDIGLESTVVDTTVENATILRPGGVGAESLAEVLGYEVKYEKIGDDEKPKSPGVKHKHYSPNANLQLANTWDEILRYRGEVLNRIGEEPLCVVLEEESRESYPEMQILKISKYNDMETYARNMYATLRYADSKNYKDIIMQTVPESGLGIPIMNRLKKAASKKV